MPIKCRKSVENDIFTLFSGLRGCPCGTSFVFKFCCKDTSFWRHRQGFLWKLWMILILPVFLVLLFIASQLFPINKGFRGVLPHTFNPYANTSGFSRYISSVYTDEIKICNETKICNRKHILTRKKSRIYLWHPFPSRGCLLSSAPGPRSCGHGGAAWRQGRGTPRPSRMHRRVTYPK